MTSRQLSKTIKLHKCKYGIISSKEERRAMSKCSRIREGEGEGERE